MHAAYSFKFRTVVMTELARPTWLPPPPTALLRPERRRIRSRPRATLVSVAIGADFERKLQALGASARLGGFDDTLLWSSERDILADDVLSTPLGRNGETFRDVFETSLRGGRFDARASKITRSVRPFCAAFKMVALWRALQSSREGDYVMWADASRYHANVTLQPGLLRRAIDVLSGASPRPPRPQHVASRWRASPWFSRRARAAATGGGGGGGGGGEDGDGGFARLDGAGGAASAYGLLTCSGWDCEGDLYTWNGQQQVVNDVTRAAFADLLPPGGPPQGPSRSRPSAASGPSPSPSGLEAAEQLLLQRPLLLNSNILLRNSAETRRFVWRQSPGGPTHGLPRCEVRRTALPFSAGAAPGPLPPWPRRLLLLPPPHTRPQVRLARCCWRRAGASSCGTGSGWPSRGRAASARATCRCSCPPSADEEGD